MRLINAHTRQIREFVSSDDIEHFAILSHTWGPDEVTLQDWQNLSTAELELKGGYRKVDYCCKQAVKDGYDWVWLDTCCIDKTSSAELSEAINSMFRWYQDAAICYAHLEDVSDDVTGDALLPALTRSRWFTRGWTLQELLAPREVVFFSQNWQKLTTKLDSVQILSIITGIEGAYLEGDPLEDASTAKKMSWAATRKTTRIEDVAYCLLGIFDVNMPLIYGEGKKAFKRLQEEIMKARPEDHTLFAWGNIVENVTDIPYLIADRQEAAEMEEIPWDASKVAPPLSGLLAESPADFKNSSGFMMANIANRFYRHAPRGIITAFPQIQDKSIRLHLLVQYDLYQSICYWERPQIATLRNTAVAILLCCHEKAPSHLPGILLRSCSDRSSFNRTREICYRYAAASISIKPAIFKHRTMLSIGPQRHIRIESGDIMLRRYIWDDDTEAMGWRTVTQGQTVPDGIIKMRGVKNGPIGLLFNRHCQVSCRHAFGLKFERIEINGEDMAGISVSLVPMDDGPAEGTKFRPLKPDFDIKWNPRSRCMRCDIPPEFRKVLGMPSGTTVIDILPFPVITVKGERVPLNPNGNINDAFIDVLDIVIAERLLPYHPTQHQGGHQKHH
ncbi:heterokaryon incompatibility protein-domain-containing protein [Xylaria sp. FL1042]|nr:heterokaryon incompatibility protein-domain-containing protein [Xylaria sp. FL1042]